MSTNTFGQEFWKEIETEIAATRKCIERVEEKFFEYKPHEKSMLMGYLTVIAAEVPKWIAIAINQGEINFATWEKYKITTTPEMVKYFDANIELVKNALLNTTDDVLEKEKFYLKMGDQVLQQSSKKDSVTQCIRHWVHHRGQLTVYMRLNDIPVPAIYGPSADDKNF